MQKMITEFNLSERFCLSERIKARLEQDSINKIYFMEEDVKEAVRLLKDKTALRKDQNDGRQEAIIIQKIIMEIEEDIDKIFGDKLI
jgi:hypothetical protein